MRVDPDQYAAATHSPKLNGTSRETILVEPQKVSLLSGAHVDATYPVQATSQHPLTLQALAKVVANSPDPDWLSDDSTAQSPGTFHLRAAITQAAGSTLVIGAPAVQHVWMSYSEWPVYIAGWQATVKFSGVTVTSWMQGSGGPDTDPRTARAYVAYAGDGSALDIDDSDFGYLGFNASTQAYGVTWGPGSTGHAVNSTFHDNYFGLYTNSAHDVVIRGNSVHGNLIYGIDPHTGSTNLTVDNNTTYDNGSHGIVFSQNVDNSTVTNNVSYGNRGDGIIMDAQSDNNVITGNTVHDNLGDGIVVQQSAGVAVAGNHIRDNRDGIRVNGKDSRRADVHDNTITGNDRGVEIYDSAAQTALSHNSIEDSKQQGILSGSPSTTSDNDTITGADTGVLARDAATITNLTVDQAATGIQITGPGVTVSDATVQARDVGVRLDAAATLDHVTVKGAKRGLYATAGSSDISSLTVGGAETAAEVAAPVHVRGLMVTNSQTGVAVTAGGAQISGATIGAQRTGVQTNSDLTLSQLTVRGPERGVLVTGGLTKITTATIHASDVGVETKSGGAVSLSGVTVGAPKPTLGAHITLASSQLNAPSPALTWLEIAGALVVGLALLLFWLQRHRHRSAMRLLDEVYDFSDRQTSRTHS